MDIVDKATRSRYMAAVKSRGNKSTEEVMARLLRRQRLAGWRRHMSLEGTPDFCWPKRKVALFVDGCFWHGCPRCYKPPKSNVKYWLSKVAGNRRRDRRVDASLRRKGWSVIRVRECMIEDERTPCRIREALARRNRPSPAPR